MCSGDVVFLDGPRVCEFRIRVDELRAIVAQICLIGRGVNRKRKPRLL